MAQGHKRRIRNFLLDPKLQLRYTLIMVALSSLLTAGLGYVWYRQMREASTIVEVKALASMDVDPDEVAQIRNEMKAGDNLRLMALVGFGILFALVLAGYGIVLTHKVAGPLFKISRYMSEVKEGRLGPVYDLRRGDQLQEFFLAFKQMHVSLRAKEEQDVGTLNQVIEATERHLAQVKTDGGAMEQPLEALREMRDRKESSLKA